MSVTHGRRTDGRTVGRTDAHTWIFGRSLHNEPAGKNAIVGWECGSLLARYEQFPGPLCQLMTTTRPLVHQRRTAFTRLLGKAPSIPHVTHTVFITNHATYCLLLYCLLMFFKWVQNESKMRSQNIIHHFESKMSPQNSLK